MPTSSILVYTVQKALINITKAKKIDKCYKSLEWGLNYDCFIGYLIIY